MRAADLAANKLQLRLGEPGTPDVADGASKARGRVVAVCGVVGERLLWRAGFALVELCGRRVAIGGWSLARAMMSSVGLGWDLERDWGSAIVRKGRPFLARVHRRRRRDRIHLP